MAEHAQHDTTALPPLSADSALPSSGVTVPGKVRAKKKRGINCSLTKAMIAKVSEALEKGYTKRIAASHAKISSEQLLGMWLKRGREALERLIEAEAREQEIELDEQTLLKVELVQAVERAESEYLKLKIDQANNSIIQPNVDFRPVKWLLAVRDPKNFAIQSEGHGDAVSAKDKLGIFETVTPEEATSILEDKLERFLAGFTVPEPVTAPAPENGGR
ncbi:hypothetical protein ACN28S_29915 [Cystobacter fuscus]